MNYWPAIKSRPPIIQRAFKGINKLDPFSIPDGFATEIKNLSSMNFPAVSTRPGYTVLGAPIGTKVLGMGVWKDTELHAVFNDGTWRKWTGVAWSAALVSGLDVNAEWSFCNFKGNLADYNLIGSNGVNPAKRYDGATVQDLSGAPAGINYIDEHDNRLYGVVNGVQVSFSELNVPTNWSTVAGNDSDPGSIMKEINTGKKIVGLKAGAGHVTVFFPTSSHELYGTSASDFSFVQVANDIGMINNKCAINLDGMQYFFGVAGNFIYGGGSRPRKGHSAAVQWYADNINQAAKSLSCVGTDGLRLYVGLSLNSATAPDTILVYDPTVINAYGESVGLWNVWNDIQPLCFAKMGNDFYIGDALGRVLKMGGTTDNGAVINYKLVTKIFSSSSLVQVIRWIRAWISANIPVGSTMNIYLSKLQSGDTDWQLVKSITANGAIDSTGIYLDTSVVANAKFIRMKVEGTGPMVLREFSREQDSLPMR